MNQHCPTIAPIALSALHSPVIVPHLIITFIFALKCKPMTTAIKIKGPLKKYGHDTDCIVLARGGRRVKRAARVSIAQTHVAMTGVAWWTCACALLALANSHIYERCELAQELQRLNVRQDHIATWVCIAFHESRFDTAAQNPYSGDHGLLQISELYWCGNGKVCGVPCSAFRDDDISDDVACAQHIHEEHTRLQGDGFLAWVVYAQHCKHNTKKYLADCDITHKNVSAKTVFKQRALSNNSLNTTSMLKINIDDLKPPYLTIGSVLRGSYANELEQNYKHKSVNRKDWVDYKVDNIDELTLPVLNKKSQGFEPVHTSTTTVPPHVSRSRVIETNQFRHGTSSVPLLRKGSNAITFDRSETTTMSPPIFSQRVIKPNEVADSAYSKITLMPKSNNKLIGYTTARTTTTKLFNTESTVSYKAERKTFTFTSNRPASPTATTQIPRARIRQYANRVSSTPPTTFRHKSFTTSSLRRPSTTTPRVSTKRTTLSQRTTTTRPTTQSNWSQRTTKHWNKSNLLPSTAASTTTSRTAVPPQLAQLTKKPFSIFDFYLNPTKRPTLAPYSAPTFDSRYKIKVFADGTTPIPHINKKDNI